MLIYHHNIDHTKMQENKAEIMNIVFSSDKNYAQLVGVALCSIFENKKGNYQIDIYILDGGILEDDIKKFSVLEKKYNFKINYIKMDNSLFSGFYTRGPYTGANYYRVIIPKILPSLSKVLYIDADMVILDDLYELYNTNIEDYLFAATEDLYMPKSKHDILNIPKDEKYFNSGILLMNLDKCRDMNVPQILLNFVKENPPEKLQYFDQDALNAKFSDLFVELEPKYNFITLTMNKGNADNFIKKNEIKIIHYAGEKPWNYLNINPMNKNYFYYLKKTPWKEYKYKNKNIKNVLKVSIKKLVLLFFNEKSLNKLRNLKSRLIK